MLDWIGIWGVWREGQYLELGRVFFVYNNGGFLSNISMNASIHAFPAEHLIVMSLSSPICQQVKESHLLHLTKQMHKQESPIGKVLQ